jgi:hypothetical protein
MKYEKPQIILLDDAISAVQAMDKRAPLQTDQHTGAYNQTISAYEADE